ncbi:uncharacterized protein [Palaemon carinicauda]|uniref:uncharacterized protein n=1 Tax=Palaemon carinicauda TaxID=392227 RepID=UPI0035B64EB9
MPFRLNTAPRIFTKLAETVVQQLRTKGVHVVAYLDDWLVWAASKTTCLQAAQKVIEFREHLGFKINHKKSRLTPAQQFQGLGMQRNLKSHHLSIPSKKRREIVGSVRRRIRYKRISKRQQERVLGSLQFAEVTDPVIKARLKDASGVWRKYASNARRDQLRLTSALLRRQLEPWSTAKSLAWIVPLQPPQPSVVIHTDASLEGWRGHSHERKVQGIGLHQFKSFHINILEAMAVSLTLKRLSPHRSTHTRLVLVNEVIVKCLNRQGSRSPHVTM